MKVYQWFYWTSNPQFWERSHPVLGTPKQSCPPCKISLEGPASNTHLGSILAAVAILQVFKRVKFVALWSLKKDHESYEFQPFKNLQNSDCNWGRNFWVLKWFNCNSASARHFRNWRMHFNFDDHFLEQFST